MGIIENRKRAKKLKEAKRKREQEALPEGSFNAARIALRKRSDAKGMITIENHGTIKYSDLLSEFIKPILSNDDNYDSLKSKLSLGVQAWNAATIRHHDEELFQKTRSLLEVLMPGDAEVVELFDELVIRKKEKFAKFSRVFVDFEVKLKQGLEFDLSVATEIIIEE
jgi:hypothetical protein